MNMIRKILVFILTAAVMVTSAGILVFHSFCSCTGDDHVSLYVTPETCAENYHIHHKHNNGGEAEVVAEEECHECNTHTNECGCNDPHVKMYKLDDRVLNDNIRIGKIQPLLIKILHYILPVSENITGDDVFAGVQTCELPPGIIRSFDFLIFIHQLKIPAPFIGIEL